MSVGVAILGIALIAITWLGSGAEPNQAAYVGGVLHSLAVMTDGGGRIFAGGHDAVTASNDGGRSWVSVPSLDDADAMGWAFLDGAIWVGGHPGVQVSTDGGTTFEPRNEGLPATDIHALGGIGSTLYAASPDAGFLVSTDEGASWQVRNPVVGHGFMGVILVDPDDVGHVVATDMAAGIAETVDGGRSWRPLGGVSGARWVSWDPRDRDVLLVAGAGEAVLSDDGGRTWTTVDVPAGSGIVTIDPVNPDRWYAGALTWEGTLDVSISRDAGASWSVA
ncbi:MAG: hypothetical protein U0V56_06820 [Actinomycetota bacterium]